MRGGWGQPGRRYELANPGSPNRAGIGKYYADDYGTKKGKKNGAKKDADRLDIELGGASKSANNDDARSEGAASEQSYGGASLFAEAGEEGDETNQYWMPEGSSESEDERPKRRLPFGQRCSRFWTRPANVICMLAAMLVVMIVMLIQGYLCNDVSVFYMTLLCPCSQEVNSCCSCCVCGTPKCVLLKPKVSTPGDNGCTAMEKRCWAATSSQDCGAVVFGGGDGPKCCNWNPDDAGNKECCDSATCGTVCAQMAWRLVLLVFILAIIFVFCWCCCD